MQSKRRVKRSASGRTASLQFVKLQAVARVGSDIVVVGVVDCDARICGTVGDLHDDADHHALEEVPVRIVHLAGKALQVAGLPGAALDELLQVTVAFGRCLFRRTGDDRHVEEAVGTRLDFVFVHRAEFPDDLVVDAVHDGRAHDHDVVFRPIHPLADALHHVHHVARMPLGNDRFHDGACDASRMTGVTVVSDENVMRHCDSN